MNTLFFVSNDLLIFMLKIDTFLGGLHCFLFWGVYEIDEL